MGWGGFGDYAPYVPVAAKRAKAVKHAAKEAKKQGREPSPVKITGRKFAKTFWGIAWCDNLEAYSDYSNRLPRGATYLRNGSVVDLVIKPRRIEAIVAGSEPYEVRIDISKLPPSTWDAIKQDCTTAIDSLLDLLAGQLSDGVMQRLTRQKSGLFPAPNEIRLSCSCPDGSYCCKHVAAVMYGVGARLDSSPDLLFTLREVDPQELVAQAVSDGRLANDVPGESDALGNQDLGALFGIELDSTASSPKRRRSAVKKPKPDAATLSQATKKKTAKVSKSKSPIAAAVKTDAKPAKGKQPKKVTSQRKTKSPR